MVDEDEVHFLPTAKVVVPTLAECDAAEAYCDELDAIGNQTLFTAKARLHSAWVRLAYAVIDGLAGSWWAAAAFAVWLFAGVVILLWPWGS